MRIQTRFAPTKLRSRALSVAFSALLSVVVPATPAFAAPTSGKIKPDLLYHNYCSVCHGDKGDGRSRASNSLRPPPKDFTTAGSSMNRTYMIAVVADGKPGTAMVGWKTQLSQAEIESVVDWIRSQFMSSKPMQPDPSANAEISGIRAHGGRAQDAMPAMPSAQPGTNQTIAADMSLPFMNGLKGNVAAGRKFYDTNCATCHGKQGDGKGPRAYFINPKPRNFLDKFARSNFNRPVLFAAVSMGRPGTEMPAWSKVINDQEIANVAEYVFQQFIRSPGGK